LAQIPVYIVKYTRSEEERLGLISPLTITEETKVLNGLKKMLTLNPEPRLKTILQTANKKLDETLITNVLERSKSDAEFKIIVNEICRVNNLVEQTPSRDPKRRLRRNRKERLDDTAGSPNYLQAHNGRRRAMSTETRFWNETAFSKSYPVAEISKSVRNKHPVL